MRVFGHASAAGWDPPLSLRRSGQGRPPLPEIDRTVAADSSFRPSHGLPRPSLWRSSPLLIGALIFLATLPYVNTLLNGFVYDDVTQVLKNPYIRDFSHLKAIFTTSVWSYAGGLHSVGNYYRPVMTLGYLFCHKIFGYKPYGFHLASIALNAATVCLLFIVTERLFHDRILAFLAAALFALLPVHTEAVDWIAAATDLELATFFLLAFWFFLRLDSPHPRRAAWMHLGMVISFALALLSKEPAATLPFLATLYEHTCREDRNRTSWGLKLRRYAALWILLIAYIFFRLHFLGGFAPVRPRAQMPANTVVFSAMALAGEYIEKLIWPVHLCAFYVFPKNMAALLPGVMEGCGALILGALLMIYFCKHERRVFFGLVWFFVTLAPVLNVRWMPTSVFAERYLYLPSAGLCWVAAWLALRLWRSRRMWRRALVGAACALAALAVARIVTRNPDWKNDLTFYTRTLAASPDAADMRNNLGMYYWDRGDLAAAGQQWEEALRLEPALPYVLDNLGLLCISQGRYREAVVFFERSLAISQRDSEAHTGLGEAYQKMGLRQQAEWQLRDAVRLAPWDVRPREHLGELYFDEGKYDQARGEFLASIRALPTLRGYFGLGLVDWAQKDRGGAERAFKAALSLDRADSRPYLMLGLLYGASGRTLDAISEYEAGLKIDPTNKIALAALAKLKPGSSIQKPQAHEP